MRLPDALIPDLKKLSAPAVYELLIALNEKDMGIFVGGQLIFVRDWVQDDEVIWQLADQTQPVLFWGGPPTQLGYYKGNLFTLILDKIYTYLLNHSIQDLYLNLAQLHRRVF
jgi:hypothetical protein